ncbi:MAG: signal peptide peptidase SppA [Phycisphaerae bacterium]|nr:signal peptide peptidase SppA [Phycisphaerae bacterium]
MQRMMQRRYRLMAVIFLGSLFLLSNLAWAAKSTKPKSDDDTTEAEPAVVPVFRLSGQLREAPPALDWGFETGPVNLHELLKRMNKAKQDSKVKAVVLTFEGPELGSAQRQEIRQAIKELRGAEKEVYCLLEDAEQATYLLSTAASRVYIVPTGEINLIGIHVESPYLKGLLDKIGVQADIEHVGNYKGAGEPFTRTGPSDEAKEMLEWLLKDLFDQMVQQIAEDRQLQPEQVRELIDRGPFTAKEAKQAKLVDEIAYPEEFTKTLKEQYGDNVKLTRDYGERKLPEIDLSSPFAVFKLFNDMVSKTKGSSKSQIAVLYVDGTIVSGKTEDNLFSESDSVGSTSFRRLVARLRDDDKVKGVVLRVNSPGGSALASDIMWHATQVLKEEKPLIVSMGNMAASGGYYVSMSGATIFAEPGTLTGSIGVIGGKMVTKGLYDWIGVSFHETTLGKHADLYSTSKPFTDEQRQVVRKSMNEVYGVFKDRVVEGRKDKIKGDIETLAGGRVYTGRQAQAKGLIDQLGGLQDAIKFAATKAKVSNYDVVEYPRSKNFFEALFKGASGDKDDDDNSVQINAAHIATSFTKLATANASHVGSHLGWLTQSPAAVELTRTLAKIDPAKARAVLQMLTRLELLSQESVLLVTPSELLVR